MRSSPRTHFGDLFGRGTTGEADRRLGAELLSMEAWSFDSRRLSRGEARLEVGEGGGGGGELLCARDRSKATRGRRSNEGGGRERAQVGSV